MIWTLFNITVISEWCAFIASILLLRKRTTFWQLFIPILFLTILAETTCWYFSYFFKDANTNLIFNLLMIVNVCFPLWLLCQATPLQHARKTIYFCTILFILFAIINLVYFQGFKKFNSTTEAFGDMLIAVTSCYFLYQILVDDKYRDIFQYEYFWLANGLLFSSLGSAVLYVFLDYLWAYYRKTHINIYGYINYVINVIFYASLIVAFICRWRTTKLSRV